MRKPSFQVVTLATALLVLLGVAAQLVKPLIPPPKENKLAVEASEFLRRAAEQRIDWHALDASAFAEARRRDLPILFVVGLPWGRFGREFDSGIFTHPDVEAYLGRKFVCVRADGLLHPELLNGFFPLSRGALRLRDEFQIYILQPDGKMVDFLVRADSRAFDAYALIDALIAIQKRLVERDPDDPTNPANVQAADVASLLQDSASAFPDFQEYALFLADRPDLARDGGPALRFDPLLPNAWMFLARVGRADLAVAAMRRLLRSSMVDWIDGGFFHIGVGGWNVVEFDKVAAQNAEMMFLASALASRSREFEFADVARSTFDALASEFVDLGLVRACRIGDEGPLDRSERSSFSPRDLREIFPDAADRTFAREWFSLRVEENPQMVVRARDPQAMHTPQAVAAMTRLRRFAESKPRAFAGQALLDVNGTVAARMLATARLLGDVDRKAVATTLYDQLDAFRAADDVTHTLDRRLSAEAYLGDYLAFADASLEDYLATGRVPSLFRGLSVLKRAVFLFDLGRGAYAMTYRRSGELGPQVEPVPQLADSDCESTSARMIRLLCDYGWLFPEEAAVGAKGDALTFSERARQSASHFADSAPRLGPLAGGYYRASLGVSEDTYVITTGPNAQSLADEVNRLVPMRFVAPAYAGIRTDVQRKGNGVFLVSGKAIQGPMSPREASAQLRRSALASPPVPTLAPSQR
ncbi:MAG: DUF255 domain-containing protein [Fimbriimonadaceae bacterium]|nr:DUF255 domain-containing protein [Chthonomonadaceae bacterium]MCO5296143.1 DUF255 domain-containing protein [Fimbriimonadaceae bacterium]